MQKLFNKILVPVDFSIHSRSAIDKAVEIANKFNCSIHLLHVVTLSPFAPISMEEGRMTIPNNMIDNRQELELQMGKLCVYINLISSQYIEIDYSILSGSWDEIIINIVSQNNFDLVLIGQKGKFIGKRNMLINPDKLASKTEIPIITVPSNKRLTKLFTIVIPITDFLPLRKLIYGIYMASNDDTIIKLLGVENKNTKGKVKYFMEKAFHLIRDNCSLKVDFEIIKSQNIADAVNQFSILQSADLVILNPGSQTKMPGLLSSFLGNIIQKYSSPPVLTISPNKNFNY